MSSKNLANYRRMFWGLWVFWLAVFFWAAFFQVNKAITVSGVLQPFGKTFSVQSSRDGKLFSILVEVGDIVSKDDPLLYLESDMDRLALEAFELRLQNLKLKTFRFEALLENREVMLRPDWASSDQWELENNIFLVEKEKLQRDLDLLEKEKELGALRIKNILEKYKATQGQQTLLEKQKLLIDSLYKQGFEGELSVLEANLKLQTFLEQLRSMESALEEEKTRVSMIERRIAKRRSDFVSMARNGIYDLEKEIRLVENGISETKLRLAQSVLSAPQSGRVSKIVVGNAGRFVSAGESVMEIVPENVPLMLYVNIPSEHISNVVLEQSAEVVLTNMDVRNGAGLVGRLVQIDGDATVSQSGQRFFEGVVSLSEIPAQYQIPGVSGSASLQLGKQSVIEYFGEPIFDTLRKSFKE